MKLQTLKPRLTLLTSAVPVLQPGSWRSDKQSSTQRGYGYAWQQARAAYLEHHPYCVYCLREPQYAAVRTLGVGEVLIECARLGLPIPYANIVDHRTPHRGDMKLFWDKTNWDSMCTTHHSGDKQREENRFAKFRQAVPPGVPKVPKGQHF